MRKLLLLILLITMPLVVHAETIKDLLQQAFQTGESKGVVTNGVADIIGVALKTRKPVPVTIREVYKFPSGCGRMHIEFFIEDGVDEKGVAMKPQYFWAEGNLCQNGGGPSEREFLEWQAKQQTITKQKAKNGKRKECLKGNQSTIPSEAKNV